MTVISIVGLLFSLLLSTTFSIGFSGFTASANFSFSQNEVTFNGWGFSPVIIVNVEKSQYSELLNVGAFTAGSVIIFYTQSKGNYLCASRTIQTYFCFNNEGRSSLGWYSYKIELILKDILDYEYAHIKTWRSLGYEKFKFLELYNCDLDPRYSWSAVCSNRWQQGKYYYLTPKYEVFWFPNR